nr:hypothetical protein [uncultured Allomuricauda sp.]
MKRTITAIVIGLITQLSAYPQYSEEYVEFKHPIEVKLSSSPSNVFKSYKSMKDKVYCTITKDEKVKVIGFGRAMYKVETANCKGYISRIHMPKTGIIKNATDYAIEQAEESKRIAKAKRVEEYKRRNDSLKKVAVELKKLDSIQRIANATRLKNECQYETNEKDEFTGKTRKYTEFYKLKPLGELDIQFRRYGGEQFVIFRTYQDLGCASPYSNSRSFVSVKLENNEIVKFYHRGDIDCGNFRLAGRLTAADKTKLLRSPIKIIRLSGTEYYHDVENVEWNDIFIDKIKCIK